VDDGVARSQRADPLTFATAPAVGAPAASRGLRAIRLPFPRVLPLVAVLAVQMILTLRLVNADTAFEDEAAYIWAGHLEWMHLLHGTPIPPFPSYFSGAPVIYPPLAALADSIGGLAAARILSLLFMLAATVLLWDVTRRLFGRQAAFFAAALFAILGPTCHLGAFATYDAMSLFLVALAAWLVVCGGDRLAATGWLVSAGIVLAIANVTAYSSILFDIPVILLALLIALPSHGAKIAASRCLTVLVAAGVILTVGLLIGGGPYVHGFETTTLERTPGGASPLAVLGDAWLWTGLVVLIALGGVTTSWLRREPHARTWLLAVMTATALLGPFEQARLHTAASLNKHVGAGAWFAAIAAGYALDKLISAAPAGRARTVTCAACVVALAFPLSLGASQSYQFSTSWPKATSFVAIIRPLVDHGPGRYLVEDPQIAEYYLHAESHWTEWSSTRNIVLPSGLSTGGPSSAAGVVGPGNAGTYGTKIAAGYFTLVALNFADTTSLDRKIAADLKANHHYHLVQVIPYGPAPGTYVIWQYEPGS
jgi:hypothetical protein